VQVEATPSRSFENAGVQPSKRVRQGTYLPLKVPGDRVSGARLLTPTGTENHPVSIPPVHHHGEHQDRMLIILTDPLKNDQDLTKW
jgi:hypothetical protein